MIFTRVHTLDRDMCLEKEWQMVEGDVFCEDHRNPFTFTITYLGEKGKTLTINEIRTLAFQRATPADQFCAESMMRNQDKIATDLQKFILVFPGTIYKDERDVLWMPLMQFSGGRWQFKFDCRKYGKDCMTGFMS